MKTIYVTCSLTLAPDSFKEEVQRFIAELEKRGYTVLKFKGLTEGTNEDVATCDIGNVKQCDLLLSICTLQSTGLGIELGWKCAQQGRVLAVGQEVAVGMKQISRLVMGMGAVNPNFTFKTYQDLSDVLTLVDEAFRVISNEWDKIASSGHA